MLCVTDLYFFHALSIAKIKCQSRLNPNISVVLNGKLFLNPIIKVQLISILIKHRRRSQTPVRMETPSQSGQYLSSKIPEDLRSIAIIPYGNDNLKNAIYCNRVLKCAASFPLLNWMQ